MKLRHLLIAFALTGCIAAFGAKVDTLEVKTKLLPSGIDKVTVITPDSSIADEKFPTVYLLNGFSGNHTSWYGLQPALTDLADNYGMVLVMPDGQDSWYWDSPIRQDIKMESFIIDELVPYIDANYPTVQQPSHRAITGLSMGGHGALWLAIRHPETFGNVGSTSGGVDIRPFPNNWKMKQWLGEEDSNKENWEEHTVINLVPALKPGQLNIIFDCGTEDFFYQVNENLHTALLAANIPHDYISRPGNHSGPYWKNAILYHLLFFNEAFKKNDTN